MKNRDVFNKTGVPKKDPEIGVFEAGEQSKIHRMYERTNPSKELADLLTLLDFSLIHRLFSELASRCGVYAGEMNFLFRDQIITLKYLPNFSFYNATANQIYINEDETRYRAFYYDLDYVLYVVKTIVHEEAHAVSKTDCIDYQPDDQNYMVAGAGESQKSSGPKIGYMRFLKSSEQFTRLFTAWEEGVNEKIARQIFLLYLEKDKNFCQEIGFDRVKKIIEAIKKMCLPQDYDKNIRFLEATIAKISRQEGLSKDFIWNAIVRSKFEGHELDSADIKPLFDKCLGPNFMRELAEAETGNDMEDLMYRYFTREEVDAVYAN